MIYCTWDKQQSWGAVTLSPCIIPDSQSFIKYDLLTCSMLDSITTCKVASHKILHFWLGVLKMLRLITNFLWVLSLSYFSVAQKKEEEEEEEEKNNSSKIISLIKFRTSGERPSCAHELEKYWACPQRKTGLYRGWLIVNKTGGMFPRQPVEHQHCHHALLAVN